MLIGESMEAAAIKPDPEKPRTLVQRLKKGKEVHDEFADEFRRTYLIGGKLLDEWREHFTFTIPVDPNPATIQELDIKLVELHQEASFLKAVADCKLRAYNSVTSRAYNAEYTRLVAWYRDAGQKLPAKDTLQALAEEKLAYDKSGLVHGEIELSFWKDVLADLANSRKVIENITLNISVELKANSRTT